MEVIEQSHQILSHGTLESVELAGRTSYKSEDKITQGSAEQFILKVMKLGHESVLEHYPLVFRLNSVELTGSSRVDYLSYQIREILEETIGLHHTFTPEYTIVSMNARTLRDAKRRVNNDLTNDLLAHAGLLAPVLFSGLGVQFAEVSGIYTPSEEELLQNLSPIEAAKHLYRMVKFITDRGVTHEIVRHRPPAYTQESTRYCNYYKRGMQVIKPVFWTKLEEDSLYNVWLEAMESSEVYYNTLIKRGATSQEARSVLPNSLKTEIVCTCNLREWHHILTLRTAKTAHPQMRALMTPLLQGFQERLPVLFNDIGMEQ